MILIRHINIGGLKVGSYDMGSTISFTQSVQKRIYSRNKKNQGFGENGADGCHIKSINLTLDDDLVDKNIVSWKKGIGT